MSVTHIQLGKFLQPAKTIKAGDNDYPLLSMTMKGGLVDPTTKFKKRVASDDTSTYKVVKRGQLVVGFPIDEGVLSFQQIFDAAIVSPAYGVWDIAQPEKVDSNYLEKFLKSPQAITYYLGKLRSTTARRRSLDRSSFLELPIPLPPLEEQKRIAGILDQADALRRLRTRALDKLNTLGQAIFHEMFGDPASNPMNWDVTPLSALGRLDRGVSKHRPRNEPALLGGEHPLIQTGDVSRAGDYILSFSSTYSDLGLAQSRMWAKGTLCITIAANIADTAILNFDACFPDSVVGFDSGHEATNFFVHRWFATVKNRLENIAPAVAQKNINLGILRTLPVINPPRDLLEHYFEKEQAIVAATNNASTSINRQEALFASLQHRAFRGEL